ncbi:hypothetical protein B7P43_G03162 [Cryptotermes secundus]|nr:hypothetical protein B7P43_G03162 [Cryptotermes secundus]PNF16979.1 hypothetical protein B7P43_G03162 [Cryptotermes secundus]
MCSELGLGIIVIPVVAILANVAIAKAFATGPSFDATQEMLTLGVCNIFGSCVCSMPTCGAFTRSAVSSASGARTPMVGLYSGTLIVLALSLLTPYFYYIPRSTLAAVLISAVAFMLDWNILKILWNCNKRDLFLVVLTFVSCLGLGVEIGLLIGVVTNVIFLLYLWARPTVSIITCKALKVVYRTFQKRQQPLILFNVRTGIKSMLQTTADVKMILYADTEKEIVDLIFGEILDLERSETIPLIEKGTQEHEVTIEIETGCIDDLIQDTLASNESSLNECGRDK